MQQEYWKPVVGWEDFYEVSNQGRVKSLPRKTTKGRILKPHKNVHGYWFVVLCRNGKPKSQVIHLLVAAAFIGPRPEGYDTRHGPLGKHVNTPENLSYGTRSENMRDCLRDGTDQNGEKGSGAKLTQAQVLELRNLKGQVKQKEAAALFGISRPNVSMIWSGKTWRV